MMNEQTIKDIDRAFKALEERDELLDKIKSDLWMEGTNMTGEYQGIWVRFRDIERIIDKYIKESEDAE